jgi:hypothetical protein
VSWSSPFEDPIPTKGKPILTLKDAADYILQLPKREAESDHWQLALHCLIEAAEDREPLMHARIGMLRALNFGKPAPERERRARKYKIVK